MSYSFDIVGIAPVIDFFNHQQRLEKSPHRSKAYLGSYICTLDSFIDATEMVHQKPDWDWDAVVNSIVQFWLNQESKVHHWKAELDSTAGNHLIVGRVANFTSLRSEFEQMFET